MDENVFYHGVEPIKITSTVVPKCRTPLPNQKDTARPYQLGFEESELGSR